MKLPAYTRYKPSGVEWLGDVPEHWKVQRADGVLEYTKNQVDPAKLAEPKVFHYSIPAIQETGDGAVEDTDSIDSNKLRLVGDELLVSKLNPRKGCVLLAKPNPLPIVASSEFITLRARGCDAKYAYYLYCSQPVRDRISGTVRSATRSHQRAQPEDIYKLWLAFPPLPEQRAIATFLDLETARLDGLVAQKEKLLALLEEKRASLITHAVTRGLTPHAPTKPSGIPWLGLIPKHWQVIRLAMATRKITNGFVGPTRDILVDQGVRYLQSLHIKDGCIRFEKPYFVREDWSCAHAKSILQTGDVLIVQTGDLGQCCVVPEEFAGCNCHALIIVQFKPGMGHGNFLSAFLRSHYGRAELLCCQTGATLPHLECGKIREIRIALPPPPEQETIMAFLERAVRKLDELAAKIETAIEKLRERRTALISAAVTGQIDVRNATQNA